MSDAMVAILGSTEARSHLAVIRRNGWGRMVVPPRRPFKLAAGDIWALDNGAFGCWRRGESFNVPAFERAMVLTADYPTPYLAVLPDIVAGGLGSLAFSLEWLGRVRGDWPWYLAVQNGMTPGDVEPLIGRVASVFIGGTTEWKEETAQEWCDFAHGHGRRCHYARAGTLRKLIDARVVGADSVDSAFPLWNRERMARLERWWPRVNRLPRTGRPQMLIDWGGN